MEVKPPWLSRNVTDNSYKKWSPHCENWVDSSGSMGSYPQEKFSKSVSAILPTDPSGVRRLRCNLERFFQSPPGVSLLDLLLYLQWLWTAVELGSMANTIKDGPGSKEILTPTRRCLRLLVFDFLWLSFPEDSRGFSPSNVVQALYETIVPSVKIRAEGHALSLIHNCFKRLNLRLKPVHLRLHLLICINLKEVTKNFPFESPRKVWFHLILWFKKNNNNVSCFLCFIDNLSNSIQYYI